MKVYVTIINSGETTNIFADDSTEQITLNNEVIKFDAIDFVSRISLITFNWPTRNINNSLIDGERYQIKIVANNNQERKIIGKNSFPRNYGDLLKLIREVKYGN